MKYKRAGSSKLRARRARRGGGGSKGDVAMWRGGELLPRGEQEEEVGEERMKKGKGRVLGRGMGDVGFGRGGRI